MTGWRSVSKEMLRKKKAMKYHVKDDKEETRAQTNRFHLSNQEDLLEEAKHSEDPLCRSS